MSCNNSIYTSLTDSFKQFLLSPYNNYKLPIEVWLLVLVQLSPIDLYNLMYSNKTFFKIVLEHAGTLSVHFTKTLSNNEEKLLFYYGQHFNNQHILVNNITFISIMNVINFANSDGFDTIYNNNNIIAGSKELQNGISREIAQEIINPIYVVSRYNAKIRYGLFKIFCLDKFKINPLMFYIIKFARYECFCMFFSITKKIPDMINTLHINNMKTINPFFCKHYNTHNLTINKIIGMITFTNDFGGKPERALVHLSHPMWNCYKQYVELLICGVKETHADYYAGNYSIDFERSLTFKALMPIIGYYYAQMFILNVQYDFDEFPYFVEIASKMNSYNIFNIEQCMRFSKTGGNLDKLLTLRDRKRKI